MLVDASNEYLHNTTGLIDGFDKILSFLDTREHAQAILVDLLDFHADLN